jgi:quercetin dioxygenase-like cupin family protein
MVTRRNEGAATPADDDASQARADSSCVHTAHDVAGRSRFAADLLARRRVRPSRRAGLGLALAGLVTSVAAVVGLALGPGGGTGPPGHPAGTAADPSVALALPSESDILVVPLTYEPGEATSWHTHQGMHAVVVLSGQLTVYDGECHGHVFARGEAYVGGTAVHLARNETDEPVQMLVAFIGHNARVQGISTMTVGFRPPDCSRAMR